MLTKFAPFCAKTLTITALRSFTLPLHSGGAGDSTAPATMPTVTGTPLFEAIAMLARSVALCACPEARIVERT